ncbi:MAG TPA: M14 family metallopeptidase [Gemmataceae bacterium]|nr:M14 family metallopeptidase [Gemmataceae bacterium]
MMTRPPVEFPSTYFASRDQFRSAGSRLGWSCFAQPIADRGPGGEELTVDAAVSPANGVERVLLVSSGLHGVEGPFGAAVQLAAMERWANRTGPPRGVRYVFLHALNPHAFAHGRRVDASNVDPNRNFLLDGEEYKGSPDGYRTFESLLNPKRPPARWDGFRLRAWLAILRHGLPPLKQALVTGQYEYPKGVYFGGQNPSATHVALRSRLREWIGSAATAVHLDIHSGLGRWGSYKLLLDEPATPPQHARLDKWFGPETYEVDHPNGVAYKPRGSFGPWCVAQGMAPDYLYLVAEFGTYGVVRMLSGLRRENQAHHWGVRGHPNTERAKTRLRELFCPASPEWRARALTQGLDLVERAAGGISRL